MVETMMSFMRLTVHRGRETVTHGQGAAGHSRAVVEGRPFPSRIVSPRSGGSVQFTVRLPRWLATTSRSSSPPSRWRRAARDGRRATPRSWSASIRRRRTSTVDPACTGTATLSLEPAGTARRRCGRRRRSDGSGRSLRARRTARAPRQDAADAGGEDRDLARGAGRDADGRQPRHARLGRAPTTSSCPRPIPPIAALQTAVNVQGARSRGSSTSCARLTKAQSQLLQGLE